VDEKWFYQTSITRKVIMAKDEVEPQRKVQSKRYITKVMFLCAVARPRADFDGKIGIWSFTSTEQALRRSKNHNKGDDVIKTVNVDKDRYREMLLDRVLPAIFEKFPDSEASIVVQQDNAGPHISPDDDDFLEMVQQSGWNISLKFQPPNSPDMNLNDLGFFRAIQSICQEDVPRNVEELIESVKQAYASYPARSINKMWLTHQQAMTQTLLSRGDNIYKIGHINKDKLLRDGNLPDSLAISMDLYNNSTQYLLENGYAV
jgi:hypothetical protein